MHRMTEVVFSTFGQSRTFGYKNKAHFQDVPFCHHVPLIAEFCPNAKHSPPFHQQRPTDQLHRSQMPANTCSNVRNASVGHWRPCPVLFCAELRFCSTVICFSRFGQEMCPFMQFRNRRRLWSWKHLLGTGPVLCWATYVNVSVSVSRDLLFLFQTGNVSPLLTLYAT